MSVENRSQTMNFGKVTFTQTTEIKIKSLITTEQYNIFQLVNLTGLTHAICLFGIVSNALNIAVFYKQGLNTTTNISFFALAVSDMACVVFTQWYCVCLNPYMDTDKLPFIARDIQYLIGGLFHVCFGRITCWITVFITAERCVGIALPLKIKQIITLKGTAMCMCIIYVINFFMVLPEYCIYYWDWKFVLARNKTFYGLVYRIAYSDLHGLMYSMTSVSGMLSFFAVIILTMFLVIRLLQKSKWRKKVIRLSTNSEGISTRDKMTMKMLIMIACVLIVCYIPGTAISLVTSFVPEFKLTGAYGKSFSAFWSIGVVFDSINSSVNVFLYYKMSTKYRQTFNEMFFPCKKRV